MKKEDLIKIAERNVRKAQFAIEHNYNRSGITEQERINLANNLEYNQIVLNLINGKTCSEYQERKIRARDKAVEWQLNFNNNNYSYEEMAYYTNYFERLAKRYGLVREFRENGII